MSSFVCSARFKRVAPISHQLAGTRLVNLLKTQQQEAMLAPPSYFLVIFAISLSSKWVAIPCGNDLKGSARCPT
jgi:hypothetical protein